MLGLTFLTYNRYPIVLRCFNSLKYTLEREDVQWYIFDNASDEHLVNYLRRFSEQYPDKVHLYLSTRNIGVAGGRDYLLSQCKVDIIGFLDSDVECHDERFLNRIEEKLLDKNIGIVGASGHAIRKDWTTLPYSQNYEGEVDTVSGYCQFFRRKDIQRLKIGIDLDFNYNGAEDDDFCFQFKDKGLKIWRLANLGLEHHFAGTWNTSGYRNNQLKLKEKWEKKAYLLKML